MHYPIHSSKLIMYEVLFLFPIFPNYSPHARTGFLSFVPFPWVSWPSPLYNSYTAKLFLNLTLKNDAAYSYETSYPLQKEQDFSIQQTRAVKSYKIMRFTKPATVLQICGLMQADAERLCEKLSITNLRFFFSSAKDKGSQRLAILSVSSNYLPMGVNLNLVL